MENCPQSSYQIRLHRNDINGEDGGDGSAVSLPRSIVGIRHCRLLYIIPAQPELISHGNGHRHVERTSRQGIFLSRKSQTTRLRGTASRAAIGLQDNGKGFKIGESRSGFGLQGMHERVAALGGSLEIVSACDRGCCINAYFPIVGNG